MAETTTTVSKELSFNDIRDILSREINKGKKELESRYWIRDLYASYFIYQDYSASKGSGLFKRTYVIDPATSVVTLGEAEQVVIRTNYETVKMSEFAFELSGDGEIVVFADGEAEAGASAADGKADAAGASAGEEMVIRWGKIFEAGDFPDKKFAITKEELADAVTNFKPVDVDLEHVSTPLDGKLGQLKEVKLAENGTDLLGGVALPKWLDNALGSGARKVSCTWNRATKQLAGLALTKNPRVSDAAVMSAFAAFAGKRNNNKDQRALNQIHSLIVEAGAECEAEMSGQQPEPEPAIEQVQQPAVSTNPTPIPTNPNPTNMEVLMSVETNPAATGQQPPAEFSVQFAQMQARLAKMEAENTKLRKAQREAEATSFADAEIEANRAYPAEREVMIATFCQAAQDDETQPTTESLTSYFSSEAGVAQAGNGTSRVAGLKALYALRPAHDALFTEQVKVTNVTKDGQVQFAGAARSKDKGKDGQAVGATEEEKAAQRQELISMTPLGKKAASMRQKGGN